MAPAEIGMAQFQLHREREEYHVRELLSKLDTHGAATTSLIDDGARFLPSENLLSLDFGQYQQRGTACQPIVLSHELCRATIMTWPCACAVRVSLAGSDNPTTGFRDDDDLVSSRHRANATVAGTARHGGENRYVSGVRICSGQRLAALFASARSALKNVLYVPQQLPKYHVRIIPLGT